MGPLAKIPLRWHYLPATDKHSSPREGVAMPVAVGHRQELSLSPDQQAAAKKFQALWATHQTTLRELQDIRLLVGVEGFKLLVAICCEQKALRETGIDAGRRSRETTTDFLCILL